MTPDIISSLVNLGSAGAVIIVVIIFLRAIKERDAEWRDFFTALSASNRENIADMEAVTERIIKALEAIQADITKLIKMRSGNKSV